MARLYRRRFSRVKTALAARSAIVGPMVGLGLLLLLGTTQVAQAVPSGSSPTQVLAGGPKATSGKTATHDPYAAWAQARLMVLVSARTHLLAGEPGTARHDLAPLLWADTRDVAANVLYVASLEATYDEVHELPPGDPEAVDVLTSMLRDVFLPPELAVRVVAEIARRSDTAQAGSTTEATDDADEYRTVTPNSWWGDPLSQLRSMR